MQWFAFHKTCLTTRCDAYGRPEKESVFDSTILCSVTKLTRNLFLGLCAHANPCTHFISFNVWVHGFRVVVVFFKSVAFPWIFWRRKKVQQKEKRSIKTRRSFGIYTKFLWIKVHQVHSREMISIDSCTTDEVFQRLVHRIDCPNTRNSNRRSSDTGLKQCSIGENHKEWKQKKRRNQWIQFKSSHGWTWHTAQINNAEVHHMVCSAQGSRIFSSLGVKINFKRLWPNSKATETLSLSRDHCDRIHR